MAQNQNHQRGLALYEAGQLQPALTAFRAAAEEYRAAGDQVLAGEMLNHVGDVLRGLKDWNAAVSAVEEALELFRALADRMREAGALGRLGAIMLD